MDNEKYGYPWRYLGLTPEEYLVENPDFPATEKTCVHVSAGQYIAY